ncbi:MAG: DinB family protein [Pedobacter sp.]|nr:MAG: DinB family protein [Pedobacter sp.]
MFSLARNTLEELINVLRNLPDNNAYQFPVESLSGATIGKHTRHIIELYQCLLSGYDAGMANYDNRKRDQLLETEPAAAIDSLQHISSTLEQPDKEITIQYQLNGSPLFIRSNYFREVYYNLEHSIHHHALIKVALLTLQIHSVSPQFGVAPSTIQYQNQCAQ